MGFYICDSTKEKGDKYHKLIKKTDKHAIIITYETRRRLLKLEDEKQKEE
jgi:hypothetical protein